MNKEEAFRKPLFVMCPECGKMIVISDRRCWFCGYDLFQEDAQYRKDVFKKRNGKNASSKKSSVLAIICIVVVLIVGWCAWPVIQEKIDDFFISEASSESMERTASDLLQKILLDKFPEAKIEVTSVELLREARGSNKYTGYAEIMYNGEKKNIVCDVTHDNGMILVQVPPGEILKLVPLPNLFNY